MSLKDNLIGLVIIFIWGFNFVVISWGVEDLPPLLMGAIRFSFVAVLGSLFVKKPNIPWGWICLYALPISFSQFAFLFSAMSFGMPAGLASLVLQSQAVFTLMFSALLIGEKINLMQLAAIALAGFGLYIIGFVANDTSMTTIGFILTIAAAASWATGNIVNRVISQKGYKANISLVVWSSWVVIIPFTLASLYFEGIETMKIGIMQIDLKTIAVLLYLALAATILGYSLWSYLLTHYPAGQVAPLTLGVPVVGLVCASVFLNETISTLQYAGIALVMLGLLVNTFSNMGMKFLRRKMV